MHEDDLTRRVVDALHVEPESPGFFDELHGALETGDRAALRRWRRAAIAFAAAALLATVAAGVLAATPHAAANVVDRTVRCELLGSGGSEPYFDVFSQPGSPPPGATGRPPKNLPPGFKPLPAIDVENGDTRTLVTLSPFVSGYQLDRTRCLALKTRPVLGRHGLPLTETLDAGAASQSTIHVRCAVARAVFRVRIVDDASGIPLRAQLLVVRASGKPVLYVDWARSRAAAYASTADCVQMQ